MGTLGRMWLAIKESPPLTKCFVAKRDDLEFHIHWWRLGGRVREIWLMVPGGPDRDGKEHGREVPPELWSEVIAAKSFEHAMAIVRSSAA